MTHGWVCVCVLLRVIGQQLVCCNCLGQRMSALGRSSDLTDVVTAHDILTVRAMHSVPGVYVCAAAKNGAVGMHLSVCPSLCVCPLGL